MRARVLMHMRVTLRDGLKSQIEQTYCILWETLRFNTNLQNFLYTVNSGYCISVKFNSRAIQREVVVNASIFRCLRIKAKVFVLLSLKMIKSDFAFLIKNYLRISNSISIE